MPDETNHNEQLNAELTAQQETLQEVLEQRRAAIEEKQENRRDRYEDLAARHQQQSAAHFQAASTMGKAIPFGQPILVGHHSEKRDRAYRGRIDGHMGKSVEHDGKASHYQAKVAAMDGNKAISSDDPDALDKLREKLAQMEARQEFMKAANKLVRKVLKLTGLDLAQQVEKLLELAQATDMEMSARAAEKLLKPDFCGRKGFPDYETKNNNANMRRVKERIAELEQQHARIAEQGEGESIEYPELGLEVVHNNILNRVQLIFDGKPSKSVRDVVKSYGFHWAPSEEAWQRQLNHAGLNAVELVINQLQQMS